MVLHTHSQCRQFRNASVFLKLLRKFAVTQIVDNGYGIQFMETLLHIVLLVFLGFLWSARLAAIKAAALSGIPLQVTISIAVVGIAIAFTGVSAVRKSWPPLDRAAVTFYIISGAVGFILPFLLENIVAPNLAVFLFAVIISTMPIMTILLAAILGLEKPSRKQALAIGLGFVTAVLIALDSHDADTPIQASSVWVLVGFAVPLVYAINTLFIASRWPSSPDTVHVAHAQAVTIGLAALVVGTMTGGIVEWTEVSRNLVAIFAIVGCEALALVVYLKITRDHGASFVSQANYISIFFAALLGFVLFRDQIGWLSVGAGLVLVMALYLGKKPAR